MNLKSVLFIVNNFENYHIGTKSYSYEITSYELDRILIEYEGFIRFSQEHTSQKVIYDKEVRYVNKPFYKFKTPQMHNGKVAAYLNIEAECPSEFNEFDTIFIVTPWSRDRFENEFHLNGRGGFYSNKSIAWLPSWIEGFGIERKAGEAFIHEWLHGVNGYLFSNGLDKEINPDNAKMFGHFDEVKSYLPFYIELMTKNLKSNGKENLGIGEDMWHKYANRIKK